MTEVNLRQGGIDLLRLVLMLMICLLHVLGKGGVLAAAGPGTVPYGVYWFLECGAYYAADAFMLISGYMVTDKPVKAGRILTMWCQVFFYSFILTALLTAVDSHEGWQLSALIRWAMPLTFNRYWYFNGYCLLFLARPALNRFLFSIDETAARRAFVLIFGLFSVIGTWYNSFHTERGYAAVWIPVLYCLGVLARRGRIFETRPGYTLALTTAVCIMITWGMRMAGFAGLVDYTAPTQVLAALMIVILFSRLPIRARWVFCLSPLAFGVYLFQLNVVIWNRLDGAFAFVPAMTLPAGLAVVTGAAVLIFAGGLLVEGLRRCFSKRLQIPQLCDRAAAAAERLIVRVGEALQ